MKMLKSKTVTFIIAMFLLLTITFTLVALPVSNAHTPPWTLLTWAYIAVAPDHVGIGQQAAVAMWVDKPMPDATETNNIKRINYQLTITRPDQTNQTLTFPYISDPTGVEDYLFTPDQVGNYSFVFYYPGQVYTWNANAAEQVFTNDTYMAATSKTAYLTVTQDPLPNPIDSYPLPTAYWTHPIEGQNNYWYTIASNWLGQDSSQIQYSYMPDGAAPNSPHIMWTKPIQIGQGGIVGGNDSQIPGDAFYMGMSYNVRFSEPIIMSGVLYYDIPLGNGGSSKSVMAVDLRTGQQLWLNDYSSTTASVTVNGFRYYFFTFGNYYAYEMYNQHGVIPEGLLFNVAGSTWNAYEPATGKYLFNVTNVPSGYTILGPSGERLIYQLDLTNHWLAEWNSSKTFVTQTSGTIAANSSSRYDWNVTIPTTIPTGSTIRYAIIDDTLLFSNIAVTYSTYYGTNDPYTVGAISLKPGSIGNLLWMMNYTPPEPQIPQNNIGVTRTLTVVDPVNRVFIFRDKETMKWAAYSLDDGSLKWTTSPIASVADWEYFSTGGSLAYGKLYYAGYAGMLYCYDTKTGSLLWTYGNGGEGNSSASGLTTPWGRYPLTISTIVDGKIYLTTSEHSPNTPMYKDALIRCLNATTGAEIWTMMDYGGSPVATSDGYLAFWNAYDGQVYVIGQGPTAMTVSAPEVGVTTATPVTIRGTVMDISAGSKQNAVAMNFPNGLPCVSDASQSAWMEYVYMQKPMPTNVTGVPVTISVLDSNGNYRQIGQTTSDSRGMFTFAWSPDIAGSYNVIASFAGSNSYYPSSAETSFYATAAPAATPTPTAATASMADLYFMPLSIGLIVLVVIIGVVLALLMIRKRP